MNANDPYPIGDYTELDADAARSDREWEKRNQAAVDGLLLDTTEDTCHTCHGNGCGDCMKDKEEGL